MKQPEWQRGGICGALSSTSQQLNLEPSEQRERELSQFSVVIFTWVIHRSLGCLWTGYLSVCQAGVC